MEAKRGVLCRNAGTIFQQVFLSDEGEWELSVQSADGKSLPGCLYHLSGNEYVIAVPQFGMNIDISITSKQSGNDSNPEDEVHFRINGKLAKWESRLNYRLNKKEAFSIRDIHFRQYDKKPEVEIFLASPGVDRCVIKGCITVPSVEVNSIVLWAIDKRGRRVSDKVILEQHALSIMYDTEVPGFTDFPFSLSVPEKNMDLCLVVEVPENHNLDTFLSLPADTYRKLRDTFIAYATCASADGKYPQWFDEHKACSAELLRQRNVVFANGPKFSIIVPLFHTPVTMFCEMVESVLAQSYQNWELILVNSTPEDEALSDVVSNAAQGDSRIKVIELSRNLGITGNTNAGIAAATGDYVSFFDHDDLLEPDILFEYAQAVDFDPDIDLLYCDEDKMDEAGRQLMPFFKPDFSIDQLRNNNFVCHMLTVCRSLLEKIGRIEEGYDGAQDHHVTLRVIEEGGNVHHVPKILYHWRATEGSTALDASGKTYATEAGIRAIQGHLDRLGIDAVVEEYGRPFTYRIRYAIPDGMKISIVIPSHNEVSALRKCIGSIVEVTKYPLYEIVIVENNSSEKELFGYYKELEESGLPVKVVTRNGESFNFSALVNYGVEESEGDVVVLLNNDTEVTDGNWLDVLGGLACREDVGAVGPTLYYPDGTYQHAGLALTGVGVTQLFQHAAKDAWYAHYMNFQDMTRNVIAVTGACMAVRKSVYEQVGGFDEGLAVAFNDVDFCLRLIEAGYVNVYTADTSLIHVESLSRKDDYATGFVHGSRQNAEKRERFMTELMRLQKRWMKYYANGDPYFSINFDQFTPYAPFFTLPR